jgi:hypothetical protein
VKDTYLWLQYSYRGDDPAGDFCDCYYNVRAAVASGPPVELDIEDGGHRDQRIDLLLPQRLLKFQCCVLWLSDCEEREMIDDR